MVSLPASVSFALAPSSRIPKALSILLCIYLIEVIVGGPGQWAVLGLPIRHMLFVLVLALYALDLLTRGFAREDLATLIWLALLYGLWVLVVPRMFLVPLAHAVSDGRPFIAAVIFPILLRLWRSDVLSGDRIDQVLGLTTFAVVFLHVCFAAILFFYGHRVGQDTAETFFCLHTGCPGIYVGEIPEGGLRVHWVGSIFILLFATRAFSSLNPLLPILLALALYFSLSRALWLAFIVLVAMMLPLLEKRLFWQQIFILALTFFLTDLIVSKVPPHTSSPDFSIESEESMAASRVTSAGFQLRYEQAVAHLEVLAENPLLGTGFGSTTRIIRSSEIPWSSESTYTALAYKLGLLGSFLLTAPAILLWRKIKARRPTLPEAQLKYLLTLISVLIMGAFNPYLINSVGITFLATLYALVYRESAVNTHEPAYDATFCKHGSV